MLSLFLALLLHPEVQKKAQDEIDAITKRERFPTFEDRPRLPFVNAICKEVLRWRPAAPLRESYQLVLEATYLHIYSHILHRRTSRGHRGSRVQRTFHTEGCEKNCCTSL